MLLQKVPAVAVAFTFFSLCPDDVLEVFTETFTGTKCWNYHVPNSFTLWLQFRKAVKAFIIIKIFQIFGPKIFHNNHYNYGYYNYTML